MKIAILKNQQNNTLTRNIWLVSLVILYSCSNKNDVVIEETVLSKFDSLANPTELILPADTIDCFLDYSNGMTEGMKATSEINEKLKGKLGGPIPVNYYKIGASSLPIKIADIYSQEADFAITDNYKDSGSKLKVAIDSIVSHKNRTSIFITDFEKVDDVSQKRLTPKAPEPHPIDYLPWAQNGFGEWLLFGNQIDIFAVQFEKPDYWFDKTGKSKYPNWIYTLIFTPKVVITDKNLLKKSVLQFMIDQFNKSDTNSYKHFTYSAFNFNVDQTGKDEAIGNANDNLVVQENITKTKEHGFEYYLFESSDLISFITDETQSDKRIINKIKISSENACFSNVQYGIKVYDVTSTLSKFSEFLNQPEPEVKADEETGKKDTIANAPLKYEYEIQPPVDGIFDFVYNAETKEIGIKLSPDFTGVSQSTIYQIDVVIDTVTLKDFIEENNILKLTYKDGFSITSLSESLNLAIKDVSASLHDKVIYTIYIKILK